MRLGSFIFFKKNNLSAAKIVGFSCVLAADIFLSAAKIIYLKWVLAADKLVLSLTVIKEEKWNCLLEE